MRILQILATLYRQTNFQIFYDRMHNKGDFYVRLLGGCGWTIRCEHDPHLNTALKALQFFSAVSWCPGWRREKYDPFLRSCYRSCFSSSKGVDYRRPDHLQRRGTGGPRS